MTGIRISSVCCLSVVYSVFVVHTSTTLAQETPAQPVVAVMVGESPIFASEVQRNVQAAIQGKSITKAQLMLLQAQAIKQLIQQRLVTQRLKALERGATEAEINAGVAQLEEQLASRNETMDDFLEQRAITMDTVREEVAFKIGYSRYLSQELTDEALEAYFEEHRPLYDGSLLNVGHILLQVNGPNKAAATKATLNQAIALRERIVSGELTFEEAAKQYSAGPSRQDKGQLGFIPRHGVMDESFSQAAFNLKQGEISPPVVTKFGVHLIRWTDVHQGKKHWNEVKEQLQKALGNDLLNDLANTQRESTQITQGPGNVQ